MLERELRWRMTPEFERWHRELPAREQSLVSARLQRMGLGHFGDSRFLGVGLFELRWKNGLRVYFTRRQIAGVDVIILWGGNKSAQDADIARARRLKARYEYEHREDSEGED